MQKFRTLAAFVLVEKQWPQKKEERRKKKNAKYYGHYVVCTAPLGPIVYLSDLEIYIASPTFILKHSKEHLTS